MFYVTTSVLLFHVLICLCFISDIYFIPLFLCLFLLFCLFSNSGCCSHAKSETVCVAIIRVLLFFIQVLILRFQISSWLWLNRYWKFLTRLLSFNLIQQASHLIPTIFLSTTSISYFIALLLVLLTFVFSPFTPSSCLVFQVIQSYFLEFPSSEKPSFASSTSMTDYNNSHILGPSSKNFKP